MTAGLYAKNYQVVKNYVYLFKSLTCYSVKINDQFTEKKQREDNILSKILFVSIYTDNIILN